MYIFNFLADSASSASSSTTTQPAIPSWVIWVVLGLLMVAMLVPSFLRSKKQKKEYEEKMSKMTIGSHVKTIGLIVGEIVSMTEDTVTLKTGDDEHYSYVTVEKRAVYEIISPESSDIYGQTTEETTTKTEETTETTETVEEKNE